MGRTRRSCMAAVTTSCKYRRWGVWWWWWGGGGGAPEKDVNGLLEGALLQWAVLRPVDAVPRDGHEVALARHHLRWRATSGHAKTKGSADRPRTPRNCAMLASGHSCRQGAGAHLAQDGKMPVVDVAAVKFDDTAHFLRGQNRAVLPRVWPMTKTYSAAPHKEQRYVLWKLQPCAPCLKSRSRNSECLIPASKCLCRPE